MAESSLLQAYGLQRNPFTDRTAERTNLDVKMLYMHSDLQGFVPSKTTYLFFGKRGSGKTTIRMQTQSAYLDHNARAAAWQKKKEELLELHKAAASGKGKGITSAALKENGNGASHLIDEEEPMADGADQPEPYFIVDLANPGHLTSCLTNFMAAIGAREDTWDAAFSKEWTSVDLLDCILSYAATKLVRYVLDNPSAVARLKQESNGRAIRQLLLLGYMYAQVEGTALEALRKLLSSSPSPVASNATVRWVKRNALASMMALTAGAIKLSSKLFPDQFETASLYVQKEVYKIGLVRNHPRLTAVAASSVMMGAGLLSSFGRAELVRRRGAALCSSIRIVPYRPEVASIVDQLFPLSEQVESIRMMYIGISAHQKLDLLSSLVTVLGFAESPAIFGDCFDEVVLLDPAMYPSAIKAFAKEVCKNDLLNVGRLHFFFPDSRIALDLNTDKILKEARFDRHFVRDLTWSRHQLADLAERRFRAAQLMAAKKSGNPEAAVPMRSFKELFERVRAEDFSSSLSKIQTPRELMIMMTEVIMRMEAHSNEEFTIAGPELEIAVQRAFESSV
ncbi:hypothetical protein FVE85_8399 [Porphyridium purpureum]|uniref:Uncharacterized protein n=1 Tax=Porphyridium purpureum TaxID=35688 RepID=A0A5J4YNA8_PORPP|nr:hypothetical protein FVE85_8399 [Porphyridium purpureum]|eukprot:POR5297..scf244_11